MAMAGRLGRRESSRRGRPGRVPHGRVARNSEVPPETRIEFRVGIHVGDVVVDGDDLFGDGVNVAARLEGMAKPGGLCISEGAYRQVRDRVPSKFVDSGEQQFKNIAHPVRVYRLADDLSTRPGSRAAPPLPDKPSIAVLPFQNMSGDPEQEYFADGMVEEIITALSHMRWLFVIARNSPEPEATSCGWNNRSGSSIHSIAPVSDDRARSS